MCVEPRPTARATLTRAVRASRLAAACLLTCLLALGGCQSGRVGPTDRLMIEDADRLHALVRPAVLDDRDPALHKYLTRLGARLGTAAKEFEKESDGRAAAPRGEAHEWMFADVQVHLVAGEGPNAFTTGGKHLYVSNALFQRCPAEEDLAAALAHAYAHLYGRDVRAHAVRGAAAPGDQDLTREFLTWQYTREEEAAADDLAFGFYARAGWNPLKFAPRAGENGGVSAEPAALKSPAEAVRRRLEALPASAREWRQPPEADASHYRQRQAQAQALDSGARAAGRSRQAQLIVDAMPDCASPAPPPAQARARQQLFPPAATPTDNEWGKGAPRRAP